jgi:hypothetical protein
MRNRENTKLRSYEWHKAHHDKVLEYSHTYHAKHKEEEREKGRIRRNLVRWNCLIHYGGEPPRCLCCGESNIEFLCIDHINGGGERQRKQIGQGAKIYNWLIKNNYPKGFRVLCANCNQSYGHYGYCPHSESSLAR